MENLHKWWKIEYLRKVKGLLIQKRGKISIRCLVYSQRLHCWLVAESFLVCQPKSGGVLGWKKLLNRTFNYAICCYWSNSLKHLKAVPQKTKPGPKYKWFKILHVEFFFFKYYYGYTTFLYSSTRSNGHDQSFFNSTFSNRKSQGQQKLAKKITHFTAQFPLKILTHFTNLNLLDIESNMLSQRNQNQFWLYKFSSNGSVWCQK